MLKKLASNRYARIGVVAFLAVVAIAIVSFLRLPVQPVAAASDLAPNAVFTCAVTESGVFYNRVHVRCSNTPGGGIYWFAVSNSDSGLASRYLSLFTTAVATGKSINIFYDPAASGAAWGCNLSDCRPISGAVLLP